MRVARLQANQREESYKEQIKTLTTKLKQVRKKREREEDETDSLLIVQCAPCHSHAEKSVATTYTYSY